MPRNYNDRKLSLSKEPSVEEALLFLSALEWRLRQGVYECRVNKTQANNISAILQDAGIPAEANVSTDRSGRYFVTVPADHAQQVINAAIAEAKNSD